MKNRVCYCFNKIKFEDFDFDDFLLDEKSYENILIYNIWSKTLIGAKPLCSIKQMGLLEIMMKVNIQCFLAWKNVIPFMIV